MTDRKQSDRVEDAALAAWAAVSSAHRALFTGLILRVALDHGKAACEDFVYRTFRAQHDDKFLAALKTLGLADKPHPQACAEFFYLANKVGGVDVQCIVESDNKAWIRYPPPRWAYMDASICGVPNEASIGMMRGFHSRCGESLGNPRLSFVCTKMTTNGDPGLEGYFELVDRDLGPDERLTFAPGEHAPPFDPSAAPAVDWAPERVVKAKRNYAISYIRRMLPALRGALGAGAAETGAAAARLVGLQLYREMADAFGSCEAGADGFRAFFGWALTACGDQVEKHGDALVQTGWRMMDDAPDASPADLAVWAEMWGGAAAAHNPRLRVSAAPGGGPIGAAETRWRIDAAM